jgi:hypothetical protein
MTDRRIACSGDWAVASDGIQWILQRRRVRRGADTWDGVSFVRSTRDVLARCMREKGVPAVDAARLLAEMSPTFVVQRVSPSGVSDIAATAKASVPASNAVVA